MKKIRVGLLCFAIWFLLPHDSGAEEFLYLPITRAPVITAGFCGYRTASGACHGGIDYDVRDDGDGIFAAAEGVVEAVNDGMGNTRRDNIVSYGNSVRVRHPNGYLTIYAHFKSGTLEVGVGDEVRAGELLGIGDNSGWSTGSHLHFEVRDARGRKVDPYGESPFYPNCGANRLWVNCPPTVWVDEDSDGDTWTIAEGDCDDANADIHPGVAELCNAIDDDCDSETDETWPLIGDACTFRPTPLCERTGVWVCEPLHRGTICEGDHEIRVERCNHLDDDCDGETDEDWPLLGVVCTAGFGECWASGVWECEPLLGGSICSARLPAGTPELCDSLDNDCDTETDEDWPELDTVCGIYPCDGTYVCSLGGSGSYCNSAPGMPEACDGLDNDCDGETDEAPAELACSDGNDCTEDVCLFGLCQNVSRDRDGDTYADDLCGGSDCNDLNPAVWEYSFAQSRMTDSTGSSIAPVLVWTGTDLGIIWADWRDGNTEIYFTRADSTLAKVGGDIRVTDYSSHSLEPSIVWTGSEYGLAWSDLRSGAMNIYFARLDTAGGKMVDDTMLSDVGFGHSACGPAIGWNGSEYDVVYSDNTSGGYDILLARVDSGGVEIGLESLVVFDGYGPAIFWTGSDYGLAWNAVAGGGVLNAYFGWLVPESPRILPADATIVMSFSSYLIASTSPGLIWQGSLFALVGFSYSTDNNEIYFARVDAIGGEIGSEVQITHNPSSSEMPTLVSRGGEYGLTWEENPSGLGGPAYFARLDEVGGMLGSEVQITSSKNGGEKVPLVWTGHEYVMTWSDNRDGDWEIYLGRIGCGW